MSAPIAVRATGSPFGYASIATPFGSQRLCVATCRERVYASEFTEDEKAFRTRLRRSGTTLDRSDPFVLEAAAQVRAYFAKRLPRFDLALDLRGTPLELEAWTAVAALATGALVSYADVARAIGRPRSHRGVARAMARSPLDLFIPAHRVLASDSTIKGSPVQTRMRRLLLGFEGYRLSSSGRVRPAPTLAANTKA